MARIETLIFRSITAKRRNVTDVDKKRDDG